MDTGTINVMSNFINTNIPPPTFTNREYKADMTPSQFAFVFFSTYILFPLLYIIFFTGNVRPIMILWQFIQSGMFNSFHTIKEYLTDVVYSTLRVFGQYTFSTYTIVKNGREIYTASSMCFYMQSDVNSVYRIDRAKYNICKWIDRQCKQYRLENNGTDPELTETHNDIYDFIIHKIDDQSFARIHRGDFTGRTHTLYTKHYRPFKKWRQVANKAELTLCIVNECDDNTGDSASASVSASAPVSETFTISLKRPYDFLLEKNEIMDKKFLQWKMYNEHGRADIAKFIGQPFSKYSLKIFYYDGMKQYANDFAEPKILTELNKVDANTERDETCAKNDKPTADNEYSDFDVLNDSHSIIVGNRYMIKVDSVLRCPVFESNKSQVYDIDNILTSFYDCSDSERDGDSDSEDSDSDNDGVGDSEDSEDSKSESKIDGDNDGEGDNDNDNASECNMVSGTDPEFEIIEDPSLH
jgi:hypothetical protein